MRLYVFNKNPFEKVAEYGSYEECKIDVADMFLVFGNDTMQCVATDSDSAKTIFGLYERGHSAVYISELLKDIYEHGNFEDACWYEVYRSDINKYLGRWENAEGARSITKELNETVPDRTYAFTKICIAREN